MRSYILSFVAGYVTYDVAMASFAGAKISARLTYRREDGTLVSARQNCKPRG
jgi:hypothetical protein